jgi:hypothetical protein
LRDIEELTSSDPFQMQEGFEAYDYCSKISIICCISFQFGIPQIYFYIEHNDECVTAAEIYKCGQKEAPNLTSEIFNIEKGNSTVVCNIKIENVYYKILVHSTPTLHTIPKEMSFGPAAMRN